MTNLQVFPIPKEKLFIWAFIPYRITKEGIIGEFYDNPCYYQELANVFAELGIKWIWQPITLENMRAVVEKVVAFNNDYIPVVLNYCDGFDEVDGYPGLSVIELLEAKRIIFTGADSNFEYLTISKIRMKRAFVEANVATARYEVISDLNCIRGICQRLGTPLIVKPAVSTASQGIWLDSVVDSDEQVSLQVQHLLQGDHGKQCPQNSIFVEQFINGREFSVFLLGSVQQPENIKIYPPVERTFHYSLSETEQFLAYDWYWAKYEEGSRFSPEEPFCRYQLVASEFYNKLCELSKRAYCAVGGNGYGRVDLRMDKVSKELFVLEVNANCAVSSKPLSTFDDNDLGASSVGTILHLCATPFAQLMLKIITEAFDRQSTKLRLAH